MYNCLLKINLTEWCVENPFGEDVASTSVIVKVADAFAVFDKFFKCFEMPLEHCTHGIKFDVRCEVASVTEFNEGSQLAEELDENNPFHLDQYEINRVWNIINDWKYEGEVKV